MKTCPQCGAEYELDAQFCLKDGATLQAVVPPPDLVGTVVADRYKVLRKLGEGGMGQVYLAEHVRIKRKSALKVMKPDLAADPDAIARFNREAANAARIDHRHVAAIYDFGETRDGLIYLAMEFVHGEPLGALLTRSGGTLPPRRVARIIAQAADALAVAHELGIVHRDLKPDNIMVGKERDGSDCVKVVDFGLAKAAAAAEQKVTISGAIVGTPAFMSPEQVLGERLDGRSDLYSLALVAFDALTGTLPFSATNVQEQLAVRVTERPRTLAEARPDVRWPAAAEAVFARALAARPESRFPDVIAFSESLSAAVAMMPPELPDEDEDDAPDRTVVVGPGRGTGGGSASPATPLVPPTRGRISADSPAAPGEAGAQSPAAPDGASLAAPRGRATLVRAAMVVVGLGVATAAAVVYAGSRGPNGGDGGAGTAAESGAAPGATQQPPGGGMPIVKPGQPGDKRSPGTALAAGPGGPPVAAGRPRMVDAMPPVAPVQSDSPATRPGGPAAGAGARPDATTQFAHGTGTAVLAPDEANAQIGRVRAIVGAADPADADLRRALRLSEEALPRIGARADSVRLLYYRARAFGLLGEQSSACGVLGPLRQLARTTPFEQAVAEAHGKMSCE